MLSWVPCRREERSWRQTVRGGTKADRTLSTIVVTIPPDLGDRSISLPSSLANLIEESTKAISALEGSHGAELGALGSLLLRTESVASSKIERITATLDDYARALHGSRANASAVAMVAATNATERLMSSAALTGAVSAAAVLQSHRILMADEPGERAHAGRLRDLQNWVGGSDHSPRGALLIPPPPDLLPDLFDDLVWFANRSDLPSLLQAAIAHAQFETLHPFTDGNGRVGRALVNAILRARRTTSRVVVPLASALVARRDSYFAALDAYRDGDVEPIVVGFADAARIAAEESALTAQRLSVLPGQWRQQLGRTREGSATTRVLDLLMTQVVVVVADAERYLGGTASSAYAAIDRLAQADIIRPMTDRTRNQIWGASALLDELEDLSLRIEMRSRKEP